MGACGTANRLRWATASAGKQAFSDVGRTAGHSRGRSVPSRLRGVRIQPYTKNVARLCVSIGVIALLLGHPGAAQQKQKPPEQEAPKPPGTPPPEQEPAEEDDSLKPKANYVFNPIEAVKNLRVGDHYWRKGKFKGAAGRYQEATRWDPGSAEAWMKLGEARDKMSDVAGARAAWEKFLEVAPEDKEAALVRKKLSALPVPPKAK
jgi:cytochrome c-type biogenesis protein CcmH/NrfG